MGLPKVGTIFSRKNVRTKKHDMFYIFLGSRNGTFFYLNRHGTVLEMSVPFFEGMIKMNECRIIDG